MNGQLVLPCCWESDAIQACAEPPQVMQPVKASARSEWYPSPQTERTYRILHNPTHTWAELNADSAEEAVRIAGCDVQWRMEDCWVRQYTGRGWGKVRQ